MNVVGKYRYHMDSAAELGHITLIVDIILVGRTKIITLHSGVWLKNATDRRIAFRLHVPISSLVAPVGSSNGQQLASDSILGPLEPCEGAFEHEGRMILCFGMLRDPRDPPKGGITPL